MTLLAELEPPVAPSTEWSAVAAQVRASRWWWWGCVQLWDGGSSSMARVTCRLRGCLGTMDDTALVFCVTPRENMSARHPKWVGTSLRSALSPVLAAAAVVQSLHGIGCVGRLFGRPKSSAANVCLRTAFQTTAYMCDMHACTCQRFPHRSMSSRLWRRSAECRVHKSCLMCLCGSWERGRQRWQGRPRRRRRLMPSQTQRRKRSRPSWHCWHGRCVCLTT